jgi:hypothetical protein
MVDPSALAAVAPVRAEIGERDPRFLLFVAMLLVAVSLGMKTTFITHSQVWIIAGGTAVLATPALVGYLSQHRRPSVEHVVPVLLGALAVAGLSILVNEWWKYSLVAAGFGVGYFLSAYLDYRTLRGRQRAIHVVLQEAMLASSLGASFLVVLALQFPLPLRLATVFLASFLATYRSYRVFGSPLTPKKALHFSLFVAQLVFFFALGMSLLVYFTEGVFAVLLLLLWYVNRGIIRHAIEDSFSWHVALEYGFFILLFLYIFLISFQPAHP